MFRIIFYCPFAGMAYLYIFFFIIIIIIIGESLAFFEHQKKCRVENPLASARRSSASRRPCYAHIAQCEKRALQRNGWGIITVLNNHRLFFFVFRCLNLLDKRPGVMTMRWQMVRTKRVGLRVVKLNYNWYRLWAFVTVSQTTQLNRLHGFLWFNQELKYFG